MIDHSSVNLDDDSTSYDVREASTTTPGQKEPHPDDLGLESSCDSTSTVEDDPNATITPEDFGQEQNQTKQPVGPLPIRRLVRETAQLPRRRKRRHLEACYGKSPLYFQLQRYGILGVYLDRELARQAGIAPRDRVSFCWEPSSPNLFGLVRSEDGWQMREMSISADMLVMTPKINTPSRRLFHSFVFGERDTIVPTEVKITEEEGEKYIAFTLPDILPPADLQSHPVILTRGYRSTILNLDQAPAAEAGILPCHFVTFGYDEDQHPEKLLIFRASDQHRKGYAFPADGRWLHHRQHLDEFNTWFFPAGTTHLAPAVRVDDYCLSPDRLPIKVLAVSIEPVAGYTWVDIGRHLPRPYLIGVREDQEGRPSGSQEEVNEMESHGQPEPVSSGDEAADNASTVGDHPIKGSDRIESQPANSTPSGISTE